MSRGGPMSQEFFPNFVYNSIRKEFPYVVGFEMNSNSDGEQWINLKVSLEKILEEHPDWVLDDFILQMLKKIGQGEKFLFLDEIFSTNEILKPFDYRQDIVDIIKKIETNKHIPDELKLRGKLMLGNFILLP